MPHCTIECSKSLEDKIEFNRLVSIVHHATHSSGLFGLENIKTRLLPYTHYEVGIGNQTFIHTTIKILQGRTEEQKSDLSETVLNALTEAIPMAHSITVEVIDLENSYKKK